MLIPTINRKTIVEAVFLTLINLSPHSLFAHYGKQLLWFCPAAENDGMKCITKRPFFFAAFQPSLDGIRNYVPNCKSKMEKFEKKSGTRIVHQGRTEGGRLNKDRQAIERPVRGPDRCSLIVGQFDIFTLVAREHIGGSTL